MAGWLVALGAGACNRTPATPAPQGEVLIVADTDLTVPRLVNRLRIDVYSADGSRWYSSRDVDRSHAGDWPASFAVVLPDRQADTLALVRLRAYASGFTRDYRGERYLARTMGSQSLAVEAPSTPFASGCPLCPRLVVDNQDTTPASEPLPGVTVDRLLAVHLRPGIRGAVRTVLRGACLGTMADLYDVRTCVDTDGVTVDENEEPVDGNLGVATPSQLTGSFEAQFAQPCASAPKAGGNAPDGIPLHDDQVCVSGGVFVLGSWDFFGAGVTDDVPQRLAAMPPFVMDKYEVTVGRWRAAVAAGFHTPDLSPYDNSGPLPAGGPENNLLVCTWSSTPRPPSERREEYPVSCTSWVAARAFCRWLGGDLPTEAQWEYAATAATAGRVKTRYPWGGDDGTLPSCSRAVFERGSGTATDDGLCGGDGGAFGPLPVTAADYDGGDRTPPLGLDGGGGFLVDLGGNQAEWTLDARASLSSECWLGAAVVSPACEADAGDAGQIVRGGYWAANYYEVAAALRTPIDGAKWSDETGWRCVYPGAAP